RVAEADRGGTGDANGRDRPAELSEFVEHQEGLVTANGLAVDEPFKDFWANLVLSSRRQLEQVAQVHDKALAEVTVGETIAWFEAKSKEMHGL
ncbi:MAG: hypothetical protein HC771_16595, partial [Synechococcales cyanobacterium CRU_2_2]|nr:hypothetical protein [Synechococcales cyanobacterium CRU_2_2]